MIVLASLSPEKTTQYEGRRSSYTCSFLLFWPPTTVVELLTTSICMNRAKASSRKPFKNGAFHKSRLSPPTHQYIPGAQDKFANTAPTKKTNNTWYNTYYIIPAIICTWQECMGVSAPMMISSNGSNTTTFAVCFDDLHSSMHHPPSFKHVGWLDGLALPRHVKTSSSLRANTDFKCWRRQKKGTYRKDPFRLSAFEQPPTSTDQQRIQVDNRYKSPAERVSSDSYYLLPGTSVVGYWYSRSMIWNTIFSLESTLTAGYMILFLASKAPWRLAARQGARLPSTEIFACLLSRFLPD